MGLVQQGKASLALFNRVFWVAQWSFTAWFMGIWPLANIIQGEYIIIMANGIIIKVKLSCPYSTQQAVQKLNRFDQTSSF